MADILEPKPPARATSTGLGRAQFLGLSGSALGAAALPFTAESAEAASAAPEPERRNETYRRRIACASAQRTAFRESVGNGDELRYADAHYIGNFTKGLPHDATGRVDPRAYRTLVAALKTRNPDVLDARASKRLREIVQDAMSIDADVGGLDPQGILVAPAPTLGSAQTAADLIELYWLALTRDVPYAAYETDSIIAQACADLSRFPAASLPRSAGAVTPATIFRGSGKPLTGPYLSQFLWLDVPQELDAGIPQRRSTAVPGVDFVIDKATWLAVQNGTVPFKPAPRAATSRYLTTGRDLADYLGKIRTGIAWESAAAIVMQMGPKATGDFDLDDFHALFGLANNVSGNAMFYQKLYVQRRARPDAVAGLIAIRGRSGSPFDDSLWSSNALGLVHERNRTMFLPQAYTYGTPPHPSYPAGHATLAGAGATILKALVNERFVVEKPLVPNADGSQLIAYSGPQLTVGGELDKLAANCAYGRGTAGVHYRSDSRAGLLLGEAAAISVLRDRAAFRSRRESGYQFSTFGGELIRIESGMT